MHYRIFIRESSPNYFIERNRIRMKADLSFSAEKETHFLFLSSLLSFLEFLAAGFVILNVDRDPKNAALFGFSILRIALLFITVGMGGIALAGGLITCRKRLTFEGYFALRKKHTFFPQLLFHSIAGLLTLLVLLGWVSLFASPYLFGKWIYSFERLRPLLIALGLSAFQILLFGWLARHQLAPLVSIFKNSRTLRLSAGLFLAAIVGLWLFMSVTGLGLQPDDRFWNVPGVPLAGPQVLGVILLLVASGLFIPLHGIRFNALSSKRVDLLLFILLFVLTVMIWMGTPMRKHADSLEPAAPSFQPYPYLDARIHDAGGLAVIKGYGINFKGYTDKPLYMVFLGGLHLLAGQNYNLLTLLQILFLAWIPPVFFLLGRAFYSRTFGLFIALTVLLRQRNSIDLAHIIDSANPKLFLTEGPTLLGLALLALCLFIWLKDARPKSWIALLSGGILGMNILIRLNPLLLFPAVIVLALLVMWRSFGKMLKNVTLFSLGLAILVVPWMFAGVNEAGQPWLYIKFLDVINVRYNEQSALPVVPGADSMTARMRLPLNPASGAKLARMVVASPPLQSHVGDITRFPYFIVNHFLHNVVGSVLALPDSLQYEDLRHLSQRSYWQAATSSLAEIPVWQRVMISANLLLISAGLGYSWTRYRWAGLVPLMIFLVYALSLGLARNSGARYITPIDWVLFFYYGLGIVQGLTVIRRFAISSVVNPVETMPAAENLAGPPRYALTGVLVGLILAGSLVPLANLAIPAQRGTANNAQTLSSQAAQQVPADLLAGSDLVNGDVLYPYLKTSGLSFKLLTPKGLLSLSINPDQMRRGLNAGESVIVGLQGEAEDLQMVFILTNAGAQSELIWSR
jgi:hypothetical protein